MNINVRPYYSEGSKTLAYEVAEQLGWRAPDHVVVPIGSGSLFTKVWKGFNELRDVGLIDGGPRRIGGRIRGGWHGRRGGGSRVDRDHRDHREQQ